MQKNKEFFCNQCKREGLTKDDFYYKKDGVRYFECKECAVKRATRVRNLKKGPNLKTGAGDANLVQGVWKCAKCGQVKPLEAFGKYKGNRHGYNYTCLECNKNIAKDCNKRNGKIDRARHSTKITVRINNAVSASINDSLKGLKSGRHWETLVPYTLCDLTKALEEKFEEGMTFQNYGRACGDIRYWEIDHITLKSLFRFTSPEDKEFQECWSLDNLRPLWWWENRNRSRNIKEVIRN